MDAVYSMDGDCAPLAALLALAERFDAWLYVDDAHGFGVLGEGRGGVVEAGVHSERLIQMVTLGKAAGVAGAAVAAHAVVIDWLVNSARPFIFTTSTSPLLAHTVQASLRLMADEPERRAALRARMAELKHQLAGLPWTPAVGHADSAAADWRQRRGAGGVGRAARARHLGAGHSPAHRATRLGTAAHCPLRRPPAAGYCPVG